MKNLIEKRKGQLTAIGAIAIALGVILAVVGLVLTLTSFEGNLSVVKLIIGLILLVLGLAGLVLGVYLSWIASAVKATHGSIAEDNLGIGTVNMNKCENCGAQVEAGVKICAKCEENLKP